MSYSGAKKICENLKNGGLKQNWMRGLRESSDTEKVLKDIERVIRNWTKSHKSGEFKDPQYANDGVRVVCDYVGDSLGGSTIVFEPVSDGVKVTLNWKRRDEFLYSSVEDCVKPLDMMWGIYFGEGQKYFVDSKGKYWFENPEGEPKWDPRVGDSLVKPAIQKALKDKGLNTWVSWWCDSNGATIMDLNSLDPKYKLTDERKKKLIDGGWVKLVKGKPGMYFSSDKTVSEKKSEEAVKEIFGSSFIEDMVAQKATVQ